MDIYRFTPQDDITNKELAEIVNKLFATLILAIQQQPFGPNEQTEIEDIVYDSLPNDLKKHFTKITNTESKN